MSRYSAWARKEYGEPVRVSVALLAGPVFLGLLPLLVGGLGPCVDRRLGLAPLGLRRARRLAGSVLLVLGFALGLSSVVAQLSRGRGTPLPVMPTQRLLTDGPFRYCRNPMTLGTIMAYGGVGIIAGTRAGLLLVLGLSGTLLFYLKRFEEEELAERFGEAYLAYRQETPFLLPRFRLP